MKHPLICPVCKYSRPLALNYCPNCRKETNKKLETIPQLKKIVKKTEKKMKLEVKKINIKQKKQSDLSFILSDNEALSNLLTTV